MMNLRENLEFYNVFCQSFIHKLEYSIYYNYFYIILNKLGLKNIKILFILRILMHKLFK
jgi:hypothetical protein